MSVVVETKGRVGYVTLDRPDKLNALSTDMQASLIEAFDGFSQDPDIWAVLLRANGDRAFCAGIDLKEQSGVSVPSRRRGITADLFEAVSSCTKPTVAALFGWTVGAGLELALACDVRLAATSLQLALPEAKRGLGAAFGSQLLPRLIPRGIAYEMLYTAEPIDADRAFQVGLVSRVVADDQLTKTAEDMVQKIVANAPLTVQRYKAAISRGAELPLAAALRLDVGPDPYTSEDRREGIAAFLEKRAPNWQGR